MQPALMEPLLLAKVGCGQTQTICIANKVVDMRLCKIKLKYQVVVEEVILHFSSHLLTSFRVNLGSLARTNFSSLKLNYTYWLMQVAVAPRSLPWFPFRVRVFLFFGLGLNKALQNVWNFTCSHIIDPFFNF